MFLMAMRRSGSPVNEIIECDVFTSVTLATTTNEDGGYVALIWRCSREIQLSISTKALSDLAYSVPLLQKPWVEVVQYFWVGPRNVYNNHYFWIVVRYRKKNRAETPRPSVSDSYISCNPCSAWVRANIVH